MIPIGPRWLTVAAMVATAVPLPAAIAAEQGTAWLTGHAFQQKLTLPATVLWADNPLGASLRDFGRVQHVAVLLDRRVDPEQKLELAVREKPVLAVIQAVAESRNLSVSVVGDVVYVGPSRSARRIRTVSELRRQEIERLGVSVARKFAKAAPLSWRDFDTPRQLLGELAGENELEIVNLKLVPHDLWAEADLPDLTLVQRISLILEQFDLTFQVASDGSRLAVVPVPEKVSIVRDYPAGTRPDTLLEQWRATAPNCEFRVAGNRIYARGLLEEHELLDGTRRPEEDGALRPGRTVPGSGRGVGEPRPAQSPGRPPEQIFTADVPNRPLGAVLTHFAGQLGLELQIDRDGLDEAGVSLDQLITFRVKEATFDELFEAVLEPVGCVYQREGNILRIRVRR